MDIAVAICTWNRADLLNATLTSLAEMTIPPGVRWRVIVADNNSTDHTQQILDQHQQTLPLKRVFVREQGKSYALNRVVRELEGDLVLWADDDVLVHKNWLEAYVHAAQRWPDAAFFGGQIVPRFLGPEPAWLRPAWRTIASVYATRELGDEPFSFDRKELPFGANMACRVAVQKQYQYDPDLGVCGEEIVLGEETALMRQWLADGYQGMWIPQSRVEHLITPNRMELIHIQRYFYGLAQIKQRRGWRNWTAVRFAWGLWHLQCALRAEMCCSWNQVNANPAAWIKYLARASHTWGRLEAEWFDVPDWAKPRALRALKRQRTQPRYQTPITLEGIRRELASSESRVASSCPVRKVA
jgi:glycosyltransferase involved in cell wall biosynthesis